MSPSVSSLVKKKTDYDTKISELGKKLTDQNHDKYITSPEFNTLAANVFNGRLAQANLKTKKKLMINCQVLTKRLLQIKQTICSLKKNWKS